MQQYLILPDGLTKMALSLGYGTGGTRLRGYIGMAVPLPRSVYTGVTVTLATTALGQ